MEKMLVVVFDNETKTYEGLRALYQLDSEGNITIHAEAVISKNNDGTITVKQGEGDFPVRTVSGTAIGSLIGLLGGPAGLAVGALAGMMAGSFADLFVAGVDSDFLAEVSNVLTPGKYAIVADISEEWVTPWIPEWKHSMALSSARPERASKKPNGPAKSPSCEPRLTS